MEKNDFKKYIAEFVGTCVLVLFGCGSAVAANALLSILGMGIPLAFSTLTISIAFGLCIVAMAYSIGNVSGCHINPAVSIGCFIAGRMTVKDLIGYIISQFAGGFAGALLLSLILGTKSALGQNGYGSASALGTTAAIAVLVEVVLTFVFVTVILGVTSKPEYSSVAGLVIGLTLTLIHIFGIPFTGTSVNPARSFGPAVLVGGDALKQLPVFIIAPIIGAVLAGLFFNFVLNTEADEDNADAETEADADESEADAETNAETEPETATEAVDTNDAQPEAENAEAGEEAEAGDTTEAGEEAEAPSGYDPAAEMIIEDPPERVAEAEAEVIEEADADAIV